MDSFPFAEDGGEHLDLILATSEIGIWSLDATTGRALRNLRHDQIFGHDELLSKWDADIFLSYVVEEDRKRVGNLLTSALEDGDPWSFETRIRRADGVDRWISAKGLPKFSNDGRVTKLIGHVIDITETKQNEDRLKLISKELNHRVSNTFAIMNSMVRHAAKKTTTVEEFAATMMERLGALSRANKILVTTEAERSSLQDILSMELAAFAGWQQRISIAGNSKVWFSGEASEALSMIFHELLTNAVKHGALSVPTGQIDVKISSGPGRQVSITWTEKGGPTVASERRKGIGSTILQSAMRDEGTVVMDYASSGVICDITVHNSFQLETPDPVAPRSEVGMTDQTVPSEGAFSGRRIMIVEDDAIIGMDLADIFVSRGATVLGPFTTVATALKGLRGAPDAALLDVNLRNETTAAIAAQLAELSIPFMVLSGQLDKSDLGDAFDGAAFVSKPFREQDLVTSALDMFQR